MNQSTLAECELSSALWAILSEGVPFPLLLL